MAQLKVNVTELGIFSGCYETVWINSGKDIDLVMEMQGDLGCEVENEFEFDKYLKGISEIYQEYLESEFDGTFTVDTIYSPKYYNYETDNITLLWDNENLSESEMKKLLYEKFGSLDDSELGSIENSDIYDFLNGYELYDSLNRYYVIGEQGNEKEIYWDNEKQAYTVE